MEKGTSKVLDDLLAKELATAKEREDNEYISFLSKIPKQSDIKDEVIRKLKLKVKKCSAQKEKAFSKYLDSGELNEEVINSVSVKERTIKKWIDKDYWEDYYKEFRNDIDNYIEIIDGYSTPSSKSEGIEELESNIKDLVDKGFSLDEIRRDIKDISIDKVLREGHLDVDKELVEVVSGMEELTDKQRLFCLYYVKSFNAQKSYKKAYGCDENKSIRNCYTLLKKEPIIRAINELKQHRLNRLMLSEDDIFQKYIDIAFADITDYFEIKTDEVPIRSELGEPILNDYGEPIIEIRNYIKLKSEKEIDGTLISSLTVSDKQGVKIELLDKMKALDWLSKRLNLLPTSERLKFKQMEDKIDLEKEKVNKFAENTNIVIEVNDIED